MPEYLLSMDAVNLGGFVYDTQDLSTIRGGSLLLLEAARTVGRWPDVECVSSGASNALIAFHAENDGAAADFRDRVRAALRAGPLAHATFVVNVVSHDGDYRQRGEELTALNRWSQLQQPTLAVPQPWASDAGPCDIDKLRPARPARGDTPRVSTSVAARQAKGRDAVQEFYSDFAGVGDGLRFVSNFEDLAADPKQGYLNGKMAVIYIDGNGFGRMRRTYCHDHTADIAWDTAIQARRRSLLHELVATVGAGQGWTTEGGEVRLQTLLWGGDEILWVVPAWKGWSTLALFYKVASTWSVDLGEHNSGLLTHGAGLVFCNHKAPIYRVKGLANALADSAKHDKTRNLFAYQTLESFEYLGAVLDAYRCSRLPPGAPATSWLLDGTAMDQVADAVRVLKEELPKKRLVEAVALARHEGKTDSERSVAIAHALTRSGLSRDGQCALDQLAAHANGPLARWVHLAELWDYVA